MVTDAFGALLEEIGSALKIPGIKPDANNCCLIKFKGGLMVQFEKDRTGDYLLIVVDYGAIPAGKYRELIFTEALKANFQPAPRYGVFAYSKQAKEFIFFERLPLKDLQGSRVAEILTPFLEKARTWKEALARGDVPTIVAKSSGMFGLQK